MTPERARYFASISKEERVIRDTIKAHKCFMRDDKSFLNDSKCTKKDRKAFLTNIHCRKILIKNLKKQLPAPLLERPICLGSEMYYFCSACGIVLISDTDNYCFKCGQKLR